MTLTARWLRGFNSKGVLDDARYLSVSSGSAWVATPLKLAVADEMKNGKTVVVVVVVVVMVLIIHGIGGGGGGSSGGRSGSRNKWYTVANVYTRHSRHRL